MLSRYKFRLLSSAVAFVLAASTSVFAESVWNCKDGTGSAVVSDSGSSKRHGRIEGRCSWAREDDRGFFLTFRNGGSVVFPNTEGVEFPKGFEFEIFFSCDFGSIASTAFSCLFCTGDLYEDGISVMVGKDGALLVNLNGLSMHYYGLVRDANIQSKRDTRLKVRYDLEQVTIWKDGARLASYPTKGSIVYKKGLMRLGSNANYPLTGNIYYASLRGLDEEGADSAIEPATELERLQNYKGPVYKDPEGTVIISDFTKFSPKEIIVRGSLNIIDKYVFRTDADFWGNGIKTMLFTPSDPTAPEISLSPRLKGRYDVYLSVRSTSIDSIVQAAIGDSYYRILTKGLGPKHRSYEMLLEKGVEMDGKRLAVAPGNNAYVGYFKLIPSEKGRVDEKFDPAGRVERGGRMTRDDYFAYTLKSLEELFKSGVMRERHFVETRKCAEPSAASQKRGYQLFNRNCMELLFKTSVPTVDNGGITLKAAAAPGEYEPVSFAVRGLKDIVEMKLSIGKWKAENGKEASIDCRVGVVASLYKRTTAYTGNSEVMMGPTYIETTDTIPSLKNGESAQFWLTMHVPDGTPAGTYRCTLSLGSDGRSETIPLELEVYPFKLERPETCFSFYGFPSGDDNASVEKTMADYAAHGMSMLVVFDAYHLLSFTGNSADSAAIDWSRSRLPFFMDCCRKHGLDKCLILSIPDIYNESTKYGDRWKGPFERFLRDIEKHRTANNWPKFFYENFDEALSNPSDIQKVLETSEIMTRVGVPMSNDHIWYKTSRAFQKQCDIIAPQTRLFINRFNTRDLWYVDTWEQMQRRCLQEGKLLMAYNSNNAIVFSQPTAARFSFGWFHRTAGKGTIGHIMYSYRETYGSPYDDLDGNCTDWLCNYPKWGGSQGGPSLDWESYREGVDDLKYIVTLEKRIEKAKALGIDVAAEQSVIDGIIKSFDMKKFYEESLFITPKWDRLWNEDGKFYASGIYNLPNGWLPDDYDAARSKIARAIIAIDRKLNQ